MVEVNPADEQPSDKDKQNAGDSQPVQWLKVYTDYGYGVVDAAKFREQLQACADRHSEAHKQILEHFKSQHAVLKTQAEAEAETKRKLVEEQKAADEKKAAEQAKASVADQPVSEAAQKQAAEDAANKSDADKKEKDQESDKKNNDDKLPVVKVEAPSTAKLLEQIQLTAEQKDEIKKVYDTIVTVKFNWGGLGFIQRRLVSSKISVKVKTLHGQRKTHTFQVSIFDKVQKIWDRLCEVEPEETKAYPTPRLVYPMGRLRILNLEDTIEKVQLPSNCTLVLMGLQSFCWDVRKCDGNIKLENKATKIVRDSSGEHNHRTVLATQGFSSGRKYWEVLAEQIEGATSIFIGVCKMQDPVTLGEMKDTYGLLIPESKKFERRPESSSYQMTKFGRTFKNGDSMGVLLEFEGPAGQASLTFFRNGASMGKAFTEIKSGEYFPCVSVNYGKNVTTLNSTARMPTEPYQNAADQVDPVEEDSESNNGGGGGGGGHEEEE